MIWSRLFAYSSSLVQVTEANQLLEEKESDVHHLTDKRNELYQSIKATVKWLELADSTDANTQLANLQRVQFENHHHIKHLAEAGFVGGGLVASIVVPIHFLLRGVRQPGSVDVGFMKTMLASFTSGGLAVMTGYWWEKMFVVQQKIVCFHSLVEKEVRLSRQLEHTVKPSS